MNKDVIYPTMVIRSQAETIKLLEEENQKYKEVIEKLEKKIKVVKQYDFDRVGRYELLDILKEVE